MNEPTLVPSELPASFGRYRLVKLLGKGGMGSVYLAEDSQLDRQVALKIPRFIDGAQILERFYIEARAAAALQHPNICPIYDVGEVDGTPYLTMAFIDGKPLGAFARARPLLPRQSAALVRKLASALQEAHKRNIVHRDLKPDNIMIDRRGEPIIMDFGLARRNRQGDSRMTQEGTLLGTPAYMPPEQIQGEVDNIGPASDIYSLGVILYELLTGQLPFAGDVVSVLCRVLAEKPQPPSRLCPNLDPELEAICVKAMAKKIEDRYASMADMANELIRYLRSRTASTGSAPQHAGPEEAETVVEPLPAVRNASAPGRVSQDKPGFRVSQMGGLRSIAQLNAGLPPPINERAISRRRRIARRRRRRWPLWLGVGAAAAIACAAVAWIGLGTPPEVRSRPAEPPQVAMLEAAPLPAPVAARVSKPEPATVSPARPQAAPAPAAPVKPRAEELAFRKTDEVGKRLDELMRKYRDRIGCSAAVLAVERDGTLLQLRASGWSDQGRTKPTSNDTLFPVGNVWIFLNASIRQQAERKGFHLDAPILTLMGVRPAGRVADARVATITVQNVMDHKTGWTVEMVTRARQKAHSLKIKNVTPQVLLSILTTHSLAEAPGTRIRTSKFCTEVLQALLTQLTGQSPIDYYRSQLFGKEIRGIAAGGSAAADAAVWNAPDGHLCASAPALLELMRHYSWAGTAPPRPGAFTWLTTTVSYDLTWRSDGSHVVILFNGSRDGALEELHAELDKVIDKMEPSRMGARR